MGSLSSMVIWVPVTVRLPEVPSMLICSLSSSTESLVGVRVKSVWAEGCPAGIVMVRSLTVV